MDKNFVKSCLNLQAVLPALGELAAADERAKTLAAGAKGSVNLALMNGPSVVLDFDGAGSVAFEEKTTLTPSVGMFFPTAAYLNRMFDGEKVVPVLWMGIWRLKLIKTFAGLADYMGSILKDPDAYLTAHPEEMDKVLSLLFGVATRAIVVLGRVDGHARSYLAAAPAGVVNFRVGEGADALGVTLTVDRGAVTLKKGLAENWNATLAIPDKKKAYELFRGRLDPMAAAAIGDVMMTGNLMTLDNINAILDLLATYL